MVLSAGKMKGSFSITIYDLTLFFGFGLLNEGLESISDDDSTIDESGDYFCAFALESLRDLSLSLLAV